MLKKHDIKKHRGFTAEADYAGFCVVRLQPSVVRDLGGRNTWAKIEGNGKRVYRMIAGQKDLKKDAIEIDYDSCVKLDITNNGSENSDGFYECNLTVTRAGKWDVFKAHLFHPNPAYRVPYQIAAVSLLLGLISLVVSFVGLL